MWRRLLVWTAPLLVAAALAAPAAAQTANQPGEDEEKISPTPALAYTVALLSTILVLIIVCKPSRKS